MKILTYNWESCLLGSFLNNRTASEGKHVAVATRRRRRILPAGFFFLLGIFIPSHQSSDSKISHRSIKSFSWVRIPSFSFASSWSFATLVQISGFAIWPSISASLFSSRSICSSIRLISFSFFRCFACCSFCSFQLSFAAVSFSGLWEGAATTAAERVRMFYCFFYV